MLQNQPLGAKISSQLIVETPMRRPSMWILAALMLLIAGQLGAEIYRLF